MPRPTNSAEAVRVTADELEAQVSAYVERILAGRQVAGEKERWMIQRFDRDLRNSAWRIDWSKPARVATFFRRSLKHVKGKMAGQPFIFVDWQAFLTANLFGFLREDTGFRRFRTGYLEHSKGPLALDTPILTTQGWSTMGELKVGDQVYAGDGTPTPVMGVSPVFEDHPCWEFEFDCGEKIVSDGDHRWLVDRADPSNQSSYVVEGLERTTAEIAQDSHFAMGSDQVARYSIPVSPPIQPPLNSLLPWDPYLLGYWLGDGDSDSSRVTIGEQDLEATLTKLASLGAKLSIQRSRTNYRVHLSKQSKVLRRMGLLHNKHIPIEYQEASYVDRLALLQGLMDSDGHCQSGVSAEFCSCNERLAEHVLELMRGLGFKGRLRSSPAKLEGRTVGTRYRITIAPGDVPIFTLPRKAARLGVTTTRRRLSRSHRIKGVRPVDSVPTRCITVAHPDHTFLAGRALIRTLNSGKTPWGANLGLYMAALDDEPRAECFIAGRIEDQAGNAFDYPLLNIRQSPALEKTYHIWGGDNASRIFHRPSGSFLRRLTGTQNDKAEGRSGPNVHYAFCDEYHEWPSSAQYDKLRLGVKDRNQSLILIATNAGQTSTGPCWGEHQRGVNILKEVAANDSHFVMIFSVDDDDDPFADEGCWPKACPTLPDAPGYDYLRDMVQGTEGQPGQQALVKRLCFGLWTEAMNPWIAPEALKDAWVEREAWVEPPAGSRAWLMMDLSANRKLTSLTACVENMETGYYQLRTWSWVVGAGLLERQETEGIALYDWANSADSDLVAIPGEAIDYDVVIETLAELQSTYDVQCVSCDSYRNADFTDALEQHGMAWTHNARRRNDKTLLFGQHGMSHSAESKKSQEKQPDHSIHLWMPRSIDYFERTLLRRRLQIITDPCVRYSLLACMVRRNMRDDRILVGEDEAVCTDPAICCVGAVGTAEHFDIQLGRKQTGLAAIGKNLVERYRDRIINELEELEDEQHEQRDSAAVATGDQKPPDRTRRRIAARQRIEAVRNRVRQGRQGP